MKGSKPKRKVVAAHVVEVPQKAKAEDVMKALQSFATPAKAKGSAVFFKTGKGQYGEGDIFIGVTVPEQRQIEKAFYKNISLPEIKKLLASKIHEHRSVALGILVMQMVAIKETNKDGLAEKKRIYDFYIENRSRINNWDLVDGSVPDIVGHVLYEHDRKGMLKVLKHYAVSENMWERRIAMVATYYPILKGSTIEATTIAKMLLDDDHDLIHKASGWMLREMGKKDKPALIAFLDAYASRMPRTMLRYAIERLSPEEKIKYMAIKREVTTVRKATRR